MREKNRKPIASIKKLPQFTTMNVIDGQAGLVNYSSLIFYSLTIDNILNIIVLLILVGVTIAAISGDNGILQNAARAKEQTEKAEKDEKETLDDYELYIKEATGEKVYRLSKPKTMENPPSLSNVGTTSSLENSEYIAPIIDTSTGELNPVYTSNNATLVQANNQFPRYNWVRGKNTLYNNSSEACNFYSIEFNIDCQEFEFRFLYTDAAHYRLLIDEGNGYEYVDSFKIEGVNNTVYYYKVSFDSKKSGNIKLELNDSEFAGINIKNGDTISKIQDSKNEKAVFIGSSITQMNDMLSWCNIASEQLGFDCYNNGVGGSGYLATNNNTMYKFYDRLDYSIIDRQPELAVIEGGINDIDFELTDIIEEADRCFKYIKEKSPNTKLIIVGVFWPNSEPPSQAITLNTELRKLALDNNLPFIDLLTGDTIASDGTIITNGTGPYITGTGYAGAEKGDGNADDFISSDSVHPNPAGDEYLGDLIAKEMYKILNNMY